MSFADACTKARRLSAKRQCIYFVYRGEDAHEYTAVRDTPENEEWYSGEMPAAAYSDGIRIL